MAISIKLPPDAKFSSIVGFSLGNTIIYYFRIMFIGICVCFFIGLFIFIFTKKRKFLVIPLLFFAIFTIILFLISLYGSILEPDINVFRFFWENIVAIVPHIS